MSTSCIPLCLLFLLDPSVMTLRHWSFSSPYLVSTLGHKNGPLFVLSVATPNIS